MAPRKIIIDTDPGQDDALAILLALGSPELEVLGITCVAGNVPLPLTIRNARLVCELAGRPDMKIFAGCERPMVRDLVTAEIVHGETGLDGPDWDEPTMPVQDTHAVDWLTEVLMAAGDGEITLCPVGPITNVAMAMVREPRIIPKIRGFKGHLAESLKELLEEFDNVGAHQSASIVRRWLDDNVSDDEFLEGTDPRLALARI